MQYDKNLLYMALSLMLAFPVISHGQTFFEGKAAYRFTSAKTSNEATFFCKYPASLMKFKMRDKEVEMIVDRGSQKMFIIVLQDKIYIERTFKPSDDDAAVSPVTKDTKESTFKLQFTGKTKTMLGYECEQWLDKNSSGETEIWATKGLGAFSAMSVFTAGGRAKTGAGLAAQSIGGAFLPVLKGLPFNEYFPMQIIIRTPAGVIQSSIEVTAIQPQVLDSLLFKPPSGFQRSLSSENE